MKLCINCQHHFSKTNDAFTLYCKATKESDLIFGGDTYNPCNLERTSLGKCGKEGINFEEIKK